MSRRPEEDEGLRYIYIKSRSPQPNDMLERSLQAGGEEFSQHQTYTDDVDLNKGLKQRENLFDYNSPYGVFNEKLLRIYEKIVIAQIDIDLERNRILQSNTQNVSGFLFVQLGRFIVGKLICQ